MVAVVRATVIIIHRKPYDQFAASENSESFRLQRVINWLRLKKKTPKQKNPKSIDISSQRSPAASTDLSDTSGSHVNGLDRQ